VAWARRSDDSLRGPTPLEGDDAKHVLDDLKGLVRYGSERRLIETFQLVPQLQNLKDPAALAKQGAEAETASLSEFGLVVTAGLNARS